MLQLCDELSIGLMRKIRDETRAGIEAAARWRDWYNAIKPRNHAFQLGTKTVDYLVLACELRDGEGD